ncbi:MAG: chaperone modulator CbpM [Oxalicibacterium faecigallinarum]|uniref:Chaperone modulatory protein CbpM n=1 Tax=Oxalicibacterium faecigallinarum TaxID=573741 RepID=A0A8J3F4I6_9BURK|nr:chaperone modulator CbpM [Oxalicibacterium faecigallinarum]MDQ7970297.1 chaperone modulator CbpM [Oxalicibacterium faecigallinarum]GGI16791.1 chaperone modulatory protein CbpM [Oxalicibacterium faecigallinarum]
MNDTIIRQVKAQVIDEEITLTLTDLCRSCNTSNEVIESWVYEGVLAPVGKRPQEWRFNGIMLRRARLARQLAEEMDVNPSGIALALDLMEQIDALHAQIARLGRS